MKFKFLALALMIFSAVTFAQTAAELKNEGNEALRSKDYATALAKFEAYIATGEEGVADDIKTVYNAAKCAYKLEKYDVANKYYGQAISGDYKKDLSTYYQSMILKKTGKEQEGIDLLEKAIKDYPNSKYNKKFVKMVTTHYAKQALEPYNAANQLSQQAAASGDGMKYLAIMKKAFAKFDEAKPLFEKVLTIDPADATAKAALANIKDEHKRYEEYKATLSKN